MAWDGQGGETGKALNLLAAEFGRDVEMRLQKVLGMLAGNGGNGGNGNSQTGRKDWTALA